MDESIAAIERWHPSKSYIVVSTQEPICDDYVIFEPNYRFSKFNKPELISQSTDADESVYLYKITLPCPFNPYIYFFLNNNEVAAIEMLGNSQHHSTVVVKKEVKVTKNDQCLFDQNEMTCLSQLLKTDDLVKMQYDISDEGKLIFGNDNKTDSEFLLERYLNWSQKEYRPYFYHDDNEPSSQIRLVYKNEQLELDLLQECHAFCSSKNQPKHTIEEFVQLLSKHFLRMFHSNTMENHIEIDHVKLIYTEYIRTLSPRYTLEFVGSLVQKLSSNHRPEHTVNNVILDTHYIIYSDKTTEEKTITREISGKEVLYTVDFHSTYFTINGRNFKQILKYGIVEFEYAFILLSE